MIFKNSWWFICFLFCDFCVGWLDERPVLESINGNLYISGAKHKNLILKTLGTGTVKINDINLIHELWAAGNASRLIERWKLGILDDIESTLQRLTRVVEGPNGLVRRINIIESSATSDTSVNTTIIKPPSDAEINGVTVRLRTITNRLRRLENKVRSITTKLRTNECSSDPCQNGGTCIDTYDSFQCHCPPQWEGSLCTVDVNECERLVGKPGGCQNGATCVNLSGTFSCTCPSGWHGFHCSIQKLACDQSNNAELCGNGYCINTNTPLGYTCICKEGWNHLGDNDPSCRKDIDECTTSRYPCSVNPLVSCHNVPGTFYCGVCPVGYTGDGFKCQDIDECLVNNGGCSTAPLVECINTLGSRRCGPCPNGYQGDGITCFFVGSCNVRNGGCHSLATCREGPNSETLCLCPSGFQGSGRGPQGCLPAENACKSNPCIHGICHSQGVDGFTCSCNDGYTGPTCNVSSNPCSPNPCQNDGTCRVTSRGRRLCECTASFSGPTCATPKQSCGGFFKSSIGYVEFPIGKGNKYDHGLSCAWVILTNQTMVLNVTFTRFALEDSHGGDECKHDYVQIHDGRSAGSQIFGRYCGNQLPNNGTIISTHNSLYIWFHSDSTVNSDGFAFNWTTIEPVCGGLIMQDHGSITSPGFPGKYPTNRDCYWNIFVSTGKRIAMHFISLMLEEHPTCGYDYIEINETNYVGQNQIGLFCNHSKPLPITSTGSHVTVHFHSDNSGNDNGFHLSFISIAGAPDCGGIFTAESGEIVSPGYHSGNYRSGHTCDWEIRLPESNRVSLKWISFDIERSRSCMFDSVQIYEGPNDSSPLAGKYCGSTLPPPLTIKSNRVLIRFETDANLEEKGFILKYEVACGGIFTEPSGILKSPFYPNHYPASKDCIYLISQPPGKAIVLTFEFMDIEKSPTIDNDTQCYFDRIDIRDGDNENSTLLTTLCGPENNMPTEPIYSTNNFMFLEFFTDAYIHNNGFKANYTTIDRECGGIYKEAPGTINFPDPRQLHWINTTNCFYMIHALPKHVIQVTWTSFPSRQSTISDECEKYHEVIEVIEGYGTTESRILGQYCPIKPPPQIMTSQSNDLTLRYHNTGDSFDVNYQATFVFLNDTHNCGGHYYADTGVIRSPNYPEKYPKNKECIWIIEARNKFLVTLFVEDFDLENSTKCAYDYLEIRSGAHQNSPLLGKFCNKQIETTIKSMTNQMYIRFVTDSSLQKKGFELRWHSVKPGCGGNLRTSAGAIISPNYPQNYYHRASCTWNIRVAAGSVIRITFIDFDLEEHIKCSFDFLEISDVSNGYVKNTQRFCGSTIPPILVSKSNQLKITFRSDILTSSRGFHLRYTTECHNKLTGFNGVIESPNFPQSYDPQSNCSWTITALPGNTINITFSHFDIQKSSNHICSKDYIRIQEGDNDQPNSELIKKCGSETEVLPLQISSTEVQVFITFISSTLAFAKGFRLEWFVHGCSKLLTAPIGEIKSPGYPKGDSMPYPIVQCEWLIEVTLDKSIEIVFEKIENTKSRSCPYDNNGAIQIYNGGNENAPLLVDNLCYSPTPVVYTSTGNQMLIKYSSEVEQAGRGFTASYHTAEAKCGGKFSSYSGVIHSANYPKNYPHNQNCEWLITVDLYHTVNLTFVDLDLERSRNCTDDYIKIFDGNSTEAPLLGIHCHNKDGLPYYVSSGHQILVAMRTDSLVSAKGFKAEYNRTCGARISVDTEGVIRSSPTLHTYSSNCSWILTASDPDDKVSLTFSHIELYDSEDCYFNHIEVYEGEGTGGPLLGSICTNKIPAPFYSTGNALTVHLTSDGSHNVGDTFDAIYSTFSNACGGKYIADSGTITSPKFPLSYPNNADCTWKIEVAPGNTISIVFNEFAVLSSENCDLDYLEIRENDGVGKLKGVFCGDNATAITSNQSIWLRFKSAENTAGKPKGFSLEYNLLTQSEITGDYGEIASPLYPRPYRRTRLYSWQITVDFNFVIRVQFLDLKFEDFDYYCYSSLKIYDGVDDEAPLLQELCSNAPPEKPIMSTSNLMYMEMDNNFDSVGSWFHLKWIKVPKSTAKEELEEFSESERSKIIILTPKNKTYSFNSPGFPNGYDVNLQYSWTFISPPGSHLLLKFRTMNLEETPDCLSDYVAIYRGEMKTFGSYENLLYRRCLSNATNENYNGTNVMTVQFVSDSYRNESGFSAIVMSECGGTFEQPIGEIVYENSPYSATRMTPYVYSCEWIVKVRPGRRVVVDVIENAFSNTGPDGKTKSDNSCRNNYLMLKNGDSASSPLLGAGKYCNNNKPTTLNTTSNYLYVKLSGGYASVRFKLKFRELGHDCGGRFELSSKTDSQQEISSPNYPNIPPSHIECTWTMMSTEEQRLTIHFLERFDLASSVDCEKEYVEIRDGATDMSPLLGRFCRNTPPSSISSKGNAMQIHYFTDIPEPRNGFKALITTGEVCGGIERNSRGGVITSPNYPESYNTKNQFCSWWIIAPPSHRGIKLYFEDLDLPYRRVCNTSDFIQIYEKLPDSTANRSVNTEIGMYCGNTKPGAIDILTNEAVIIFESTFTTNKLHQYRGFRLNYTFNYGTCGGAITGMRGEFHSVGYPRTSGYKYCNWKISVPEGFQVVVTILDLDLNDNEGQFNFGSHVSFHHDYDAIAIIARWKNTTRPMRIESSSNIMSIYYISSGSTRGMKARFYARAPAPCGDMIDDWTGTFSSPQIAPFNETSYFCKWIVKQPEDLEPSMRNSLTLSMTFTGYMNRGKSKSDCSSYLCNIYIKGQNEPLARICGNLTEEPVTVTSSYKSHTIEAINATKTKANFVVNYKWHKCGGIITEPSEIIKAPINVTYPVHCSWKVKFSNSEESVLTTFINMNLGPCTKSFIRIKGKNYRSPILGKFCGNEKPQDLISPYSTNEITIDYYATSAEYDFEIRVDPSSSACGGLIKGRRTELRSPRFPQNYPSNTECIWEIEANNGFHVGLSFKDRFQLESSKDCQNDYVEVYEWKEEILNNADHWKSLGKVCGREPPEKPFNTTSNKMKVKFVSNDKIEGEGFKAVWYPNCGGIYNASEIVKIIESPNYGSSYPSNYFCNYTIIGPEEQDLILEFTNFNLEGWGSKSCDYDNVTIVTYYGDWLRDSSTYCGNNKPPRRITKGKLEISFRSDNSINRGGYRFKYYLNDCGGVITSPKIIRPTLDNDPESYTYMSCNWIIQAPPKKSVLIRFEEFNLSQPLGGCVSNYITIYEGNSTESGDQKAQFCGNLNERLPVLQSNGNTMTVSLHAGSYGAKDNALKAAVFFVNGPEQGCGGNLNVNKTRTFKTQLTEFYEPLQDCHWLITAPQGYTIQFTIEEIDLKNTTFNNTIVNKRQACHSDYIEVRDGGPYAELIGHFCGNQIPPAITTTTNLLWIRFISDGINQGRGVKGTLRTVTSPCGVVDLFTEGDGPKILTSPNYPNTYPSDITCRWVIHANAIGSFKKIRVIFEDFNLENSELCENEYLQIADMNNRAVISEGFGDQLIIGQVENKVEDIIMASRSPHSFYRYCGTSKPHDYHSDYKKVEIIYKAKSSNMKNKGFKLEYSKATCSRNYTGLQGRIVHDDVVECWMTITVPEGYTISIYFNHLFLPGSDDCSKSYMQIREGGFDGHIIQSVCNYDTPNPVFSMGNRISIYVLGNKLRTYYNHNYDFTYTSSDKGRGCGGRLYNYGGVFTSPMYPNPYRNNSYCIWDVSVPRGMKVALSFKIFDIGQKNMCQTDNLNIIEFNSEGEENLVMTYCGGDTPADYHSRNDRIRVRYETTHNNGGTGWVAHFAAV